MGRLGSFVGSQRQNTPRNYLEVTYRHIGWPSEISDNIFKKFDFYLRARTPARAEALANYSQSIEDFISSISSSYSEIIGRIGFFVLLDFPKKPLGNWRVILSISSIWWFEKTEILEFHFNC